jgi:lathosterol oxidase
MTKKWPDVRREESIITKANALCKNITYTPSLLLAMDLVLKISDDLILDRVWAHLVPLSAFGTSLNATTKFLPLPSSSSTWSQLVSHLPHPPLSHHDLASTFANSQSRPFLSAWPRDYIPRQILSLSVLTLIGIHLLYFIFAGLSYKYIFNHDMMRHPRFLKNQVRLEIQTSVRAFPVMMLLTLPWFQAEVMGYSKLYDGVDTYGYFYLFASVPL